ncbi:hypothetical protein GYMLUDRAFT_244883 [Collybiopsis luxurians FD-317 M1]|uniref:Unplaced genomic scaffold GYMLUscaffold_30, whole genome shotgun sequence n=1 Tax=Collybiopsis luxurians FD-317 M1 TaxID=944289 RepID=A0A0D0CUV3_9AGAR|nr:hypothetical protein GYMLUDRAFT_244883 [Collybiopsis luxurians FD-317 M1]
MRTSTLAFLLISTFLPLFQVAALRGDSQCGYLVCVNATVEGDIVTYQMTARKERMGWLGLGFGHRMAGSDMVVMWRNEDGSLTISQRHAKDHTEPEVDDSPLRTAFLPPQQATVWDSKLNPKNTLSFSIPIDRSQWIYLSEYNASFEQLIWAYGMGQPASSDPYTSIYGHYAAGSLKLNLEKDLEEAVPNQPAETSVPPDAEAVTEEQIPYSTHERIVLAHGVLLSFGMLVLLPAGSLVARWTRTFSAKWFKAHKILNYFIALPVIVIGWLLGPYAVFDAQANHFMDAHQICGIIVLVLYLLQLSLGRYIHARRGLPNRAAHAPSNILHVFLGLIVIGAGFFQVRSGMEEWGEHTGRDASHWCHVLWRTWIIVLPVIYLLGLSLLKRQFYQESNGLNPSSTPQHYVALSPDEGHRSMLFTAETDDQMADSYGYPNSTAAFSKEAETAVPLLQRK